jgi:transcriptional regulator with XRE-family HTH domain
MYPNLKLQLWKAGVRQNRLAKMLQMDESTVSRIVNGFRVPSAEVQTSIACLLGCDLVWLFESPNDGTPREENQSEPITDPGKQGK